MTDLEAPAYNPVRLGINTAEVSETHVLERLLFRSNMLRDCTFSGAYLRVSTINTKVKDPGVQVSVKFSFQR